MILGVLDTNVVITGLDRSELPDDQWPTGFAVSAVTLAELQFGVLTATDGEERMRRIVRLNDAQRGFTVLRVEEDVAASYGLVAAASRALNRSPRRRVMDLLIAATAHAYNATLFTRNPDDFQTYGNLVDIRTLPPRRPASAP